MITYTPFKKYCRCHKKNGEKELVTATEQSAVCSTPNRDEATEGKKYWCFTRMLICTQRPCIWVRYLDGKEMLG